jgi:hypothetical protein
MPLSRLENFLKNAEGNILYVNPSDFDATDSFENRGNSLTRPFRTIQRALIEAARFSYQVGRNNDKIDNTTVLVYPGTHYIDNRPGFSIQNISSAAVFKRPLNFGWTTSGATITEFTENSNFDIFDEDNDLRKFNSIEGGVILPRGTSIVGLDLRKTKIRPLYVPDPENENVSPSSIFRVTGTCYFTSFTLFDADPNRPAYKDTTVRKVAPNFSHHKLTCFEYADGVNLVRLGSELTDLTDLEMYYYKITHAYGDTSGRGLANFPVSSGTDFEPSIDEYRIVGDLRANAIGITSIRSGNGIVPTQTVTVSTDVDHNLFKDTPILISGITTNISSYNGSFLVSDVVNNTTFTYTASSTPTDPLPTFEKYVNANIVVESDSVSSASPYIFSCTLRSVYGMNGLHADGNKATGFKSMLTAQFTGISLQKDDNAFILYDPETGIYNDNLTVSDSQKPLHTNSKAIYKTDYENVHMKCSNNAIIQCVSIFAIGYAKHFVAESGGDQSITNSNSNFGAIALESSGFRSESFDRDDVGYITHIIPPREPAPRTTAVSWLALDAAKIVSVGITDRLYLADYTSPDIEPPSQIDSYRIGAKRGEELYLSVIISSQETTFKSPILMDVPSGIGTSAEKVYEVGRVAGINSVTSNIFTLKTNHQLFNGESIRIYSDTGELPSNIQENKVYYAYTTGLNPNQIKISSSLNDANAGNTITGISNGGGILKVVSSVSDKRPGQVGHPIQYDNNERQWYILGSKATIFNTIYGAPGEGGIVGIGTSILGSVTGATFITRKVDNRGLEDRIYKIRYVIPKEFINARPPTDGFILQESKTVGVGSASFLSSSIDDPTQLRNPKIIVGATYNTGTVTIKTELPHNLVVGDRVKITNIVSSNNLQGTEDIPYNGTFEVFSVPSTKQFTYTGLSSSPGTFLNQTNQRSTQQQVDSLPVVQREKYRDSLFIYRSSEIKKHIPGIDGQDGIYIITALSGSISPNQNVGFGLSEKRFNQDIRDLYPQQDRDNFDSDPRDSVSHAKLFPLGKVVSNDKKNSITKEALNVFLENNRIGYAVTGVVITGTGNTTVTIFTNVDHNLNQIKSLSLIEPGQGYNNSAGVTSTLYSAELSNPLISGKNATVKSTISVGNTITSIEIVDSGCAYGVGNTMTISASPAATPTQSAVVQVTEISNNVGDTLELTGFADTKLNGVFRIVSVPSSNSVAIFNPNGIGATYLPRTDDSLPIISLVSEGIRVSNINFNKESGIATVTCLNSHGLLPGNAFKMVGTGNTFFSDKFTVSEIVGITTFNFNAGITTITQTVSASGISVHKYGYSANGRALGAGEENIGGRGSYIYAGITTTLASDISKTTSTFTLSSTGGISKGDYLIVNAEIVRVSNNPVVNTITVNRGQFSTAKVEAVAGSVIRKIRILPMEVRRHSILRASGHTFEYLGYGPGNYSTGLPVVQDRVLSNDEVLVSQAREQDGGTVVYTGMNDRGEFFSGATKINGATGEEEVIEAPIVTFFGDDADAEITKRNSGVFDDLVVKERITVEGGENSNQTSQFYGPVNFSQKVTNSSEDGLETRDLYIKGVASQPKLITVGISTPIDPKKSGDISLLALPEPGGYIGHAYVDGDWRRWGNISREKDSDFLVLDKVGIGQSSGIYNFRDALEVNGTVKVKNLYVGGAVTFAGNQAIGQAVFDEITINNQTVYIGSGSSNYTIRHTNADSIAQFQRMEVTGTAATFTNATVRFENSFNSVFSGISTVAGTLNVGNLVCNAGVITSTELIGTQIGVQTITVYKDAFITNGIITSFNSSIGTCSNFTSQNSNIISLSGVAATITTYRGTDAFIQGMRAELRFATPTAHVNTGVITALSGTNLNYSSGTFGISTSTNKVVTDWIGSPTAYVNSGIITTATIRTLRGNSSADPLTAFINVGVITAITGTGATYTNAQITSKLWISGSGTGEGIYANAGIISAFGPGATSPGSPNNMNINCGTSGQVTAQIFNSTVATGTAPLSVNSTTQVSNLNASLLQGWSTDTANTANRIVRRDQFGNFRAGVVTATQFSGSLQFTIQTSGVLTGGTFDNSGNLTIGLNGSSNNTANYAVIRNGLGGFAAGIITATTFVGNLTGNVNGNAATATTATNANTIATISRQLATPSAHFLTFVDSDNGSSASELLYTSPNIYYLPDNTASQSNLYIRGDITAFAGAASDDRLKTNRTTISNALQKVLSLSGFTFNWNEKAISLGFVGGISQVGVSAQQVQEVLPEAVKKEKLNDEEILIVKYEKIVPLLIEAIKELKNEIDELKRNK